MKIYIIKCDTEEFKNHWCAVELSREKIEKTFQMLKTFFTSHNYTFWIEEREIEE